MDVCSNAGELEQVCHESEGGETEREERESDEGDATSTSLNREVFFSDTVWIKPMTSSAQGWQNDQRNQGDIFSL